MTIGRFRIINEEDYQFALDIVRKCMDSEKGSFRDKLLGALAYAVEMYENGFEGFVPDPVVFDFYAEGVHQNCGTPWYNTARGDVHLVCGCSPILLFLERHHDAIMGEMEKIMFDAVMYGELIPPVEEGAS